MILKIQFLNGVTYKKDNRSFDKENILEYNLYTYNGNLLESTRVM